MENTNNTNNTNIDNSNIDKALRIVLNVQEVNRIKELSIENQILKRELMNSIVQIHKLKSQARDLFDNRGENTLTAISTMNNEEYLKYTYGENYKEKFNYEDNVLSLITHGLDLSLNNFTDEEIFQMNA